MRFLLERRTQTAERAIAVEFPINEITPAAILSFSDLPHHSSLSDVARYILRHPVEMLVRRWNWKTAAMSGAMRGAIYFFTHLTLGWRAALSAMSVEFVFRTFNTGALSSISQAFRRVRPQWKANAVVMLAFPTYSHIIEYLLHVLNGDQNVNRSIVVSIMFSALSAIFNLFTLRRGAFLVKDAEQKSLWKDLRSMPRIFAEFVAFPFLWAYRTYRRLLERP